MKRNQTSGQHWTIFSHHHPKGDLQKQWVKFDLFRSKISTNVLLTAIAGLFRMVIYELRRLHIARYSCILVAFTSFIFCCFNLIGQFIQ